MKKILSLIMVMTMLCALSACSGGSTGSASAPAENSQVAVKDLDAAICEFPMLITSGGQSADYQMIGNIAKKQNMDYTINGLATEADLGNAKTLVVVVGGSSKGLGAAGVDADGELARLTKLIETAKANGLKIVCMHTGGEARRGDLSDKFIKPIFGYADYAIVLSTGDADGLMSGICANNNIPMTSIKSLADVATVLPKAFK